MSGAGLQRPRPAEWRLRLFVSGASPRAAGAVRALRAICDAHLAGRYRLEVVDVYQQPGSARDAQIVATPTLVRERPLPRRLLVGDFADVPRVLAGLGVP